MSSKIEVSRELAESLMSGAEAMGWSQAEELRALLAAPVVERQDVIDLDAVDWETIQQAADESNWMPNEYMRNEWVADVCNFLKYGRADTSQPAPVSVVLPERKTQGIHQSHELDECFKDGWNSCLDEVTRLNTK